MTVVQADSGSPADLDRLFAAVRDRHGRVDIVYASAGIGSVTEPLEAVTTAAFDDVVRPHLDGGAAGRGIRGNLISPGPIDTATAISANRHAAMSLHLPKNQSLHGTRGSPLLRVLG